MPVIRVRPALLTTIAALLLPVSPSVYADPPPWAPAHGWRKKHDPYYQGYSGTHWEQDYGIINGKCNREAIGTVLGGVVGGAIGSSVGKDGNKGVAIILGTVLGAVIGNRIGKSMDDADRACIGHALELAADRRTVNWTGAEGLNYMVTPMSSFDRNGMKCREYRLRVNGRNVDEDRKEKACLVSEGHWEVVD
ncbi:MAG: glycine zipper domain-containing protein [Methylophilaceae bacterium]